LEIRWTIESIPAAIGAAGRAIEILTGPIENVADEVRTGSGKSGDPDTNLNTSPL
jgi:hypothetical protein